MSPKDAHPGSDPQPPPRGYAGFIGRRVRSRLLVWRLDWLGEWASGWVGGAGADARNGSLGGIKSRGHSLFLP